MEERFSSEGKFTTPTENITSYSGSLSDTVGFDPIGSNLGADFKDALQAALEEGAVFSNGTDPISIFRQLDVVTSPSLYNLFHQIPDVCCFLVNQTKIRKNHPILLGFQAGYRANNYYRSRFSY